jgi:DNA-binding transcriptional MerR regulator
MSQDKFLVHELAKMAGTTVRTIRYYTDEGLLTQPEYEGKYAYYSSIHLKRLELIRLLKDAYLPLREIRQIMLSIKDDEDLQRMIEHYLSDQKKVEASISTAPDIDKGSDALEYIKRLKDRQEMYGEKGNMNVYQSPSPVMKKEYQKNLNFIPGALDNQSESETWQRIPIIPGVELFLHQPTEPEVSSRVQQLIVFAKKLFNKI